MNLLTSKIIKSFFNITYPGGVLPLDRPRVMGILNVTPDSFSDGGKFYDTQLAIEHGLKLLSEGADILDIGGESTRPGAKPVSVEEELKRVIPVIEGIKKEAPDALISIDSYKSEVAEQAIKAGARMVNDISGLRFDHRMVEVVSRYQVPVVIMHIKGTPKDMQDNPQYEDLISEIRQYFLQQIKFAVEHGISQDRIIIDPGIGFGKKLEHNYEILAHLEEFKELGYPILVGPSRKSFIGNILNLPPQERLWGTAAAVTAAILKGAEIIRVHDVKEMLQVIKIAECIKQCILSDKL